MQLGQRWPVGATPPAALSAEWCEAVAAAEREHVSTGSWTLTWLEGRPQIAHDSGLTVTAPPSGRAESDGDDW